MDKLKKQATVKTLQDVFGRAGLVVVTRQSGMSVAETTALRRQMRQAGAHFRVAKNRLTRRAAAGTQFEGIGGMLKGPTAIAWSEDSVAAAKVVVEFAKKNELLTVVGGALGAQALDAAGVKTLAALPSLKELRAQIVGALNAPASRLVAVLQAPGGQLARVTKARADKTGPA